MGSMVQGVTVRREGNPLERVNVQGIDCQLLATSDDTELIRQQIPSGRCFCLRPQEGRGPSWCYILDGQAVGDAGDASTVLTQGDCLVGAPVGEPCVLQALTDLTLLHVGMQPSFYRMGAQVIGLEQLSASVEAKDGYTAEHCSRIRDLALRVGARLALTPAQRYTLHYGALLHDLGKVAVPDAILQKPGPLTDAEWSLMRMHPDIGGRMLGGTAVASAARVLREHHERVDGSGYPLGLTGDEICVEAQIVAVVDSYDAMTTDRVYRRAMPKEAAIAELERGSGSIYSGVIVNAFRDAILSEP